MARSKAADYSHFRVNFKSAKAAREKWDQDKFAVRRGTAIGGWAEEVIAAMKKGQRVFAKSDLPAIYAGLYPWMDRKRQYITAVPATQATKNEDGLIPEEGDDDEDGINVRPPDNLRPEMEADVFEGCFLERAKLEQILERLRTKKNLILQGPPGTGKTWLAKRLAFALIGERDDSRVRAVQFHPNLSYEDFVRGYRPAGDGKLSLVDGPFLEIVHMAKDAPASLYVIVIEEINRGNPAQIFGEMLTLLEADKRTQAEALELSYRRTEDERVYIPDNMYVIGTMNIADRSLALVDLALRRRFAFIDLEPTFGQPWRNWVQRQCDIDLDILGDIEERLQSLNAEIAADRSLGPQFRIGHSYVTPPSGTDIVNGREWFRQVVETELGPLLDEYWFDEASDKAAQAKQRLLEGF